MDAPRLFTTTHLTSAQRDVWVDLHLSAKSSIYILGGYLQIDGAITRTMLGDAIDRALHEFDSLRLVFETGAQDGVPLQRICPTIEWQLPEIDFSARPDGEAEALRWIDEQVALPFEDLSRPLFDFALIKVGPERHYWYMKYSHLVFDGWSIRPFLSRVAEHYAAACADTALAPVERSYLAYAEHEQAYLQSERYAVDLAYWASAYKDRPEPLFTESSDQSAAPARLTSRLARSDFDALCRLASSWGLSISDLLIALVALALGKAFDRDALMLGTTTHNRPKARFRQTTGMFTSVVPLRIDLAPDHSVENVAAAIKARLRRLYQHQQCPSSSIAKAINGNGDTSAPFEATFSYEPFGQPIRFGDAQTGLVVLSQGFNRHALHVAVQNHQETGPVPVHFDHDPHLAPQVAAIAGIFAHLVQQLLSAPDQRLDCYVSVPPVDAAMLGAFALGEIRAAYANTDFLSLFAARVAAAPHAIAITKDGRSFSYAELDCAAEHVAAHLRSLALPAGTAIAVGFGRAAEQVAAFLGILRAGLCYVPIDPALPLARRTDMLVRARVAALLTPDNGLFPEYLRIDIDIATSFRRPWPDGSVARAFPYDLPAYVIFTSGSTGAPAAVLVSRAGIGNLALSQADMFGIGAGSKIYPFASIGFDASISEFVMTLAAGACLDFGWGEQRLIGAELWEYLGGAAVTHVTVPPSLLRVTPPDAVPSGITLIVAGEHCPPEVIAPFRNVTIFNAYGPTETTVCATIHRYEAGSGYFPIGRPLYNLRCHILDRDLRPVPIGLVGDLYIGGPALALGYLQDPGRTAERFVPDPFGTVSGARLYHTGDRAQWLPDGAIAFRGRQDQQVKINGHRIEPEEIEAALLRHPEVQAACVLVSQRNEASPSLTAYIVPRTHGAVADAKLASWRDLYDDIFTPSAGLPSDFDITGWTSSYDDTPLPEEAMREWLHETVEDVLRHAPRAILEIGCGAGLLMARLARHCDSFIGTDLSAGVLARAQALADSDPAMAHVRLLHRDASDFRGLEPESQDLVLLNSVTQYFPSQAYLEQVIEGALRLVRPGGAVYVGDVRSLPLREAFCLAVEAHRARGDTSAAQLIARAEQRADALRELLIDPAFFQTLPSRDGRIRRVGIRLKQSRSDNELTQFRYQVVLEVGDHAEAPEGSIDWIAGARLASLADIEMHLAGHKGAALGLEGLGNARLADVSALRTWAEAQPRARLDQRPPIAPNPCFAPADLARIARHHGRQLALRPSRTGGDFAFDAIFYHGPTPPLSFDTVGALPSGAGVFTNRPKLQDALDVVHASLVPALHRHLQASLPAYMLPRGYSVVEALPLTINGKLDRAALPEAASNPPRIDAGANSKVQALQRIWSAVLGVRVGPDDAFADLGGDSIQCIQIANRARAEGLNLRVRQIFELQTIAEIAPILDTIGEDAAHPMPDAEEEAGFFPLTPIQRWFFDQGWANPALFVQHLTLPVTEALRPAALVRAFAQVQLVHASLRLRFVRNAQGWEQQFVPEDGAQLPFAVVDFSHLAGTALAEAIAADSQARIAAIDPFAGPIWTAAYYRTESSEDDRLFWGIHHLAVDGVSWRILLDALEDAYRQPTVDAVKQSGSSFGQWSRALARRAAEFVASPALESEIARISASAAARPALPQAPSLGPASAVHVITCDAALSSAVLRARPETCGGHARDLLAAALVAALGAQADCQDIPLLIESHGREPGLPGLDIAATVGWFTTLFPVIATLDRTQPPSELVASVRARIASATATSFEYSIARGLATDHPVADKARALRDPEVTFGYLGSFVARSDGGIGARLGEASFGLATDPASPALNALDVQAVHWDGRLEIRWTAAKNRYSPEQIADLAASFERHLRRLARPDMAEEKAQAELDRAMVVATCPATPSQQGILLHAAIEAASGLYVEQLLFDITGILSVERLKRATQRLIERHEALRTRFRTGDDGSVRQEILGKVALPWQSIDLRGLEEAERDARIADIVREDRLRGLPPEHGPLFRLTLLTIGDDHHRLLWTHSHALIDGWSMAILVSEWLALYRHEAPSLAPPQPMRRYAEWLAAQADQAGARAYWRKLLAGFESATVLPFQAEPAGAAQSSAPEAELLLGRELTARLTDFARQHRTTLSTLFSAAWGLLLSRCAQTSDVVFGTIDSGRSAPVPGAESIVGLMIRAVPVRLQIDENAGLDEILRQLQSQQYEREAATPLSLAEIQELSDLPRGEALFDSLLVFENYPVDADLDVGDLAISFQHLSLRTNYPLTLAVIPGERIAMRLAFRPDRLAIDLAPALLHWFESLLEQIVSRPETEAQHWMLREPQSLAPLPPAPAGDLVALFEGQVLRCGDAPAIVERDRTFTYAELNQWANRVAKALIARGIGAEDVVGIHLPRDPAMVAAVLGVLKAGAAYVPLDARYPAQRIQAIIANARLQTLIGAPDRLDPPDIDAAVIDIDRLGDEDAANPGRRFSPDQLAYVLHTSGSTGQPKGVALPMRGPMALIDWAGRRFSRSEIERVLFATSLNFDLSVFEIFLPLCHGGSLVVAEDVLELPRLQGITLVNTVPAAMAELIRTAPLPASVRTVNLAGEPVPQSLVDAIASQGSVRQIYNLYGPTETSTYSTFARLEPGATLAPPIGAALDYERTYILDHNLNLLPEGVAGQLYIGGAGLARGYLHDGSATAASFVPDPYAGVPGARMYRTGDLARQRTDGQIDFLGRADDQVKIRGFRIELGEIEVALNKRADIAEAVVTVRRDGENGAELVAHVVPYGHAFVGIEALRRALEACLPDYMVPRRYNLLDRLPRNASGKIARRVLADAVAAAPTVAVQPAAYADETEAAIAAIFAELLRLPAVSPLDDFFDLGGHSLLVMRLANRIRTRFGFELSLEKLFEAASPRDLALLINSAARTARLMALPASTSLIPLREGSDGPPLFLLCPASGSAAGYLDLARDIAGAGPIWGLQAPGLFPGERPLASVRDLASHLVGLARLRQPEGRFLLAGWSFGGVVALEMAHQLTALGRASTVVLIDTEITKGTEKRAKRSIGARWRRARGEWRAMAKARFTSYAGLRQWALWIGISLPARRNALVLRSAAEKWRFALATLGGAARAARLFVTHWLANRSYCLPRLHADVVLLRTQSADWQDAALDPAYAVLRAQVQGSVETLALPGTHMTLFDDTHRPMLAAVLARLVARHAARDGTAPMTPPAPALITSTMSEKHHDYAT